jgi:hypothetical protein
MSSVATAPDRRDDAALSKERDALLEEEMGLISIGTWCIYIAIPWALLRRIGIDPLSGRGRLLTGVIAFGWLFGGAVVVASVTGTLGESPLLAWLALAAIEGVLEGWFPSADSEVQRDQLSLDAALSSIDALRAKVARDRRTGGVMKMAVPSAAFGLVFGAIAFLATSGDWSQIPPGSIWLLMVVLFWVGEWIWTAVDWHLGNLFYVRQRYELPSFRPIDSPVIQAFIRGTNRHMIDTATISTTYLIYVVLLLAHDTALLWPSAALILVTCYGLTIVRVVSDRWVVAHVVGDETSRRLANLGSQIEALLVRVPDLSSEDERKLDQLRKAYDDVRDAPRTTSPSNAVGRVVRTSLVPTLTFVGLAAAEGYIGRLLNKVLDWLDV